MEWLCSPHQPNREEQIGPDIRDQRVHVPFRTPEQRNGVCAPVARRSCNSLAVKPSSEADSSRMPLGFNFNYPTSVSVSLSGSHRLQSLLSKANGLQAS